MRKLMYLSTTCLILLTAMNNICAQSSCQLNTSVNRFYGFVKSESKPVFEKGTSMALMHDMVSFTMSYSFIISGDNSYLQMHYWRRTSKRFNFGPEDYLCLKSVSGDSIVIYPSGAFEGSRIINIYVIGCLYQLSKEQVEFLSSNEVEKFRFTVTTEKLKEFTSIGLWDAEGWRTDENGKNEYSAFIEARSKRKKLQKYAKCFLSNL